MSGRALGGDVAGGEGGMLHTYLQLVSVCQKLQHNWTAAIPQGLGEEQGLSLRLPPFQSNMMSAQLGMNLSCCVSQALSKGGASTYRRDLND